MAQKNNISQWMSCDPLLAKLKKPPHADPYPGLISESEYYKQLESHMKTASPAPWVHPSRAFVGGYMSNSFGGRTDGQPLLPSVQQEGRAMHRPRMHQHGHPYRMSPDIRPLLAAVVYLPDDRSMEPVPFYGDAEIEAAHNFKRPTQRYSQPAKSRPGSAAPDNGSDGKGRAHAPPSGSEPPAEWMRSRQVAEVNVSQQQIQPGIQPVASISNEAGAGSSASAVMPGHADNAKEIEANKQLERNAEKPVNMVEHEGRASQAEEAAAPGAAVLSVKQADSHAAVADDDQLEGSVPEPRTVRSLRPHGSKIDVPNAIQDSTISRGS